MSKVREERDCSKCKGTFDISFFEEGRGVCRECRAKARASAPSQDWANRTEAQERACIRCWEVKARDNFGFGQRICYACRGNGTEGGPRRTKPPAAPASHIVPTVASALPIPKERANTKGELRQGPAKDPAIPKFAPKGVYGIAAFWADHPEAHRAWYEVLREDGIPASDKRYVHPLNDTYK